MDRVATDCDFTPFPPGDAGIDVDQVEPGPSSPGGRARVETASLFAWSRGRWGLPLAAVLCDASASGATVVIGTNRPLRPDRTYALRLPRATRQPLWLLCAVESQEELGRGLLQVTFRFASQILAAEAA